MQKHCEIHAYKVVFKKFAENAYHEKTLWISKFFCIKLNIPLKKWFFYLICGGGGGGGDGGGGRGWGGWRWQEKRKKREKEEIFPPSFTPQMSHVARTRPSWSQEPGNSSESHMWVDRTQVLVSSLSGFPGCISKKQI